MLDPTTLKAKQVKPATHITVTHAHETPHEQKTPPPSGVNDIKTPPPCEEKGHSDGGMRDDKAQNTTPKFSTWGAHESAISAGGATEGHDEGVKSAPLATQGDTDTQLGGVQNTTRVVDNSTLSANNAALSADESRKLAILRQQQAIANRAKVTLSPSATLDCVGEEQAMAMRDEMLVLADRWARGIAIDAAGYESDSQRMAVTAAFLDILDKWTALWCRLDAARPDLLPDDLVFGLESPDFSPCPMGVHLSAIGGWVAAVARFGEPIANALHDATMGWIKARPGDRQVYVDAYKATWVSALAREQAA